MSRMYLVTLTLLFFGNCSQSTEQLSDATNCDCRVAEQCVDGKCVAGPCAGTTSCSKFGKCTAIDGVCQAGTNADCAQSDGCRDDGECAAANLRYDDAKKREAAVAHRACWQPAASNEDCRGNGDEDSPCAGDGRCVATNGVCLAGSPKDCEDSASCKDWGGCAYKNGECWRPAETREECSTPIGPDFESPCRNFGFCTVVDGVCVTGADADCEQAFVCTEWGECTAHDGECWQRAK